MIGPLTQSGLGTCTPHDGHKNAQQKAGMAFMTTQEVPWTRTLLTFNNGINESSQKLHVWQMAPIRCASRDGWSDSDIR